jgi:hypothetical protein
MKCFQHRKVLIADVPATGNRTYTDRDRPESGGIPMILERLTAWTLVIVYYTITCGALVLSLKGSL